MRAVRVLGGILAGLVLVVVLALAVLLLVDADAYKGFVEDRLTEALGREVRIANLDVAYGGTTDVTATGITVAATPEVPESRIEEARIGLRLWPLLGGRLHVEHLTAGPGELHLAPLRDRDDDPGDGGMRLARLDGVEISDIRATYRDGGRVTEAGLERLVVDHRADHGDTTIQGRGSIGGAPFVLDGTTAQPDQVAAGLDRAVPIDLTATLAEARLTAKGELRPGPELDATIAAEAPELADLLRLVLIEVPAIGPARLNARLQGGENRTTLTDLEVVAGRDGGALQAELSGGVESLTELAGVDLRFAVAVPDIRAAAELVALPAEVAGALDAHGRIVDRDGHLAIVDLDARAVEANRHDLQIAGEIGRLSAAGALPVDDANLTVAGTVWQLPAVPGPAGALLAELGPATLEGRITGGGDAFVLEDVRVGSVEQAPVRLTAAGRIGRLVLAPELRLDELEIGLEGVAPSLQALAPVLAALRPDAELPPLPDFGPVTLQAQVSGGTADGFRLSGLEAGIAEGPAAGSRLQGTVADMAAGTGVDLRGTLRLDNLARLSDTVGAPLPAIAPFHATAGLTGDARDLAVRDLEIEGGAEPGARLSATGSIASLARARDFTLQAQVQAPALAALHAALPATSGEVTIQAALSATPEGVVELRDAHIIVGNTELAGTAVYTPGDPRPRLEAHLSSPHLRLDALGLTLPGQADVEPQGPATRVFSEQPLPVDGLPGLDADLTVEAEQISYGDHHGNRFLLTVAVENGRLSGRLDTLDFGHGSVEADFGLDAAQSPPAWSLSGRGDGIEMSTVSDLLDRPMRIDGRARSEFRLTSRGHSPAEIAANLNGEAAFASDGGVIETAAINYLAADLLQQALRQAARQRDDTDLECLLADFQVEDGIAHVRTLFLSTDAIRIAGRGDIDLRREAYDLSLLPNPKDPALFSLSTRVHVTGPLNDPRVTPDAGSLAISALKAIVGNALLPGAGLLLPMLEAGAGGDHPCAQEVQQTASDAGPIEEALRGVGGAVEGVGKGIGGAVRGLGRALGID